MFSPATYFALLIATCTYALLRGNLDARLIALLCIGGTTGTVFLLSPMATRFYDVELGALIVDLAVLVGFVGVALKSRRFWPLWVAGLQLTSSFAHLLKAIDLQLMPHAYGIAMAFWSYPILLILAVGTWRAHRRRTQRAFNHEQPA